MTQKVVKADRLSALETTTIWEVMTPLANEHKAVNLGQGFPNLPPPPILADELKKIASTVESHPLEHQYGPVKGTAEMVTALRGLYSERFSREVLASEVTVSNGVTQGLNALFEAFVNPGDEVIFIEPFYDAYITDVVTLGGVCKYVPLIPGPTSDEWRLSIDTLKAAITHKTKFLLVNTPQNVPGKAWNRDELEAIAQLAIEHDFVVIADEVYMNLIYDKEHISIATLPGMWERTITLCSAGKTFSCTGWKVGWLVGPAALIGVIAVVISYQTFCIATPFQLSIARAMLNPEVKNYYEQFRNEYKDRLNTLTQALDASGIVPVKPDGGFFITASIEKIDPKHYYNPEDSHPMDWQFALWLTKTIGVCALPLTAFCSVESRPLYEKYVRFAYCKTDSELKLAAERLAKLKEYLL